MINKFKNTKLFIDGFSKQLVKLVQLEIDKKRTRVYKSGTYNSPIRAFGRLSNSLSIKKNTSKDQYNSNIEALSYGIDLDDNKRTPRKQPPQDKILQWLKKKNTSLKDIKGKIISLDSAKAKGIAFAIAKKIGRENVQPTGFISSALKNSLSILDKLPQPIIQDIKDNLQDILLEAGYIKKGDNFILKSD